VRNLVIIGASYLQAPLIKRAKEMGFSTHVFAWERDADAKNLCDYFYPISITDIDSIAAVCDQLKPVGIVTIASDLAAVTVQILAKRYALVCNSDESMRRTSNKGAMRDAFRDAALPTPKYAIFDSTYMRVEECAKDMGFPLIIKPVDRSGSRGISRVDKMQVLIPAIKLALSESFNKQIVIESFITGVEASIETVSWDGQHHILAITDKLTTGAPHFVELEQHQPSLLPEIVQDRIREIIPAALDALYIRVGASHAEVIVDVDGNIWLTEIGARMGGDLIGSHLVRLSTGYDFVGAVIDVATGSFHGAVTTPQGFAGVQYWNPPEGVISGVKDSSSDYPEIVESAVFIEPGTLVRGARHSGERAGYFVYKCQEGRFPYGVNDIFTAEYSHYS
jgi:biotin carboxylase